jgi:Domain of unknown function (DUF5134)
MTNISPLSAFWPFLCLLIALFYLLRLLGNRIWLNSVDVENEVGHGVMAIGMAFMFAPASFLTSTLINWNIILFAITSLWWTLRLLVQKPLLAILRGTHGEHSSIQSDSIHVLMHVGMCYMFLSINSMTFSMTQPAAYLNCVFFVSLAFLTFFYGREISNNLRTARVDWLKQGADLAHLLMCGMMAWMFLEMISMTMSMRIQ